VIRAAGGVVWRRSGDRLEVLLVHRPRYDDWTFPKGKLDPGEGWEQAAVREVFEETGVVALLGPELQGTEYPDRDGRLKRVRYWSMSVAAVSAFEADEETSALRWVPVEAAAGALTYPRDHSVLASFVDSGAAEFP
jgi:8-oxo-dGTP pyrophosphatase MutT (NUDIX family)